MKKIKQILKWAGLTLKAVFYTILMRNLPGERYKAKLDEIKKEMDKI